MIRAHANDRPTSPQPRLAPIVCRFPSGPRNVSHLHAWSDSGSPRTGVPPSFRTADRRRHPIHSSAASWVPCWRDVAVRRFLGGWMSAGRGCYGHTFGRSTAVESLLLACGPEPDQPNLHDLPSPWSLLIKDFMRPALGPVVLARLAACGLRLSVWAATGPV